MNVNLFNKHQRGSRQPLCAAPSPLWLLGPGCPVPAILAQPWQKPRQTCDHCISKPKLGLAWCLAHSSSCASNCFHFESGTPAFAATAFIFLVFWLPLMVLLIFMRSEKINIRDNFLWMEMLWFQAPEKTTAELHTPRFSHFLAVGGMVAPACRSDLMTLGMSLSGEPGEGEGSEHQKLP